MNVPFVDLQQQYQSIKPEVDQAVLNIFEECHFILGPEVREFEDQFASYCEVEFSTGVGSGTDAPHLALRAMGVGEGDEVITQANTFIATLEAIIMAGAKPVLVDMKEDTYNMDPELLEAAITDKTKVIIPVHLYGQPAQMDEINKIAKAHHLFVLEDNAQAVGAKYKGNRTGSLGDAASTSFYPGKNLGAYGDAGAVTTNNEEWTIRLRMMRDHGSSRKYYHETWGMNSRLDGVQAAVLQVKMKYIDSWNEKRRQAGKMYSEKLAKVDQLTLPVTHQDSDHIYHLYVVQAPNEKDRDGLMEHLKSKSIGAGIHYPIPPHLQPGYQQMGYKLGDFPVTEAYAPRIISLPIFPEITEEQIDYVVDSIKEYFA